MENYRDSIKVSTEEARIALKPIVTSSKKYFYSLGFTDTEISEMITSHQVPEEYLVAFTIGYLGTLDEGDFRL